MWIICLYSPALGFADGALTRTVIVTYHVSNSSAYTGFTHMSHTTDVLKIAPIWGNLLKCKSTSTMADVGDGQTDEVMQICQKLWRKKIQQNWPSLFIDRITENRACHVWQKIHFMQRTVTNRQHVLHSDRRIHSQIRTILQKWIACTWKSALFSLN